MQTVWSVPAANSVVSPRCKQCGQSQLQTVWSVPAANSVVSPNCKQCGQSQLQTVWSVPAANSVVSPSCKQRGQSQLQTVWSVPAANSVVSPSCKQCGQSQLQTTHRMNLPTIRTSRTRTFVSINRLEKLFFRRQAVTAVSIKNFPSKYATDAYIKLRKWTNISTPFLLLLYIAQ